MKNQRGFALLWPLIIILGILVVSGSAYFYLQTRHIPASIDLSNFVPAATSTGQTEDTTQIPSATIDQSSLALSPGHWTVTGTAAGISDVAVSIIMEHTATYTGGRVLERSVVPVVDSRWSYTLQGADQSTEALIGAIVNVGQGTDKVDTTLASGTLTVVGTPQSISVPGMSQYTDADFGFSFWYPSGWTVTNMSETGKGMFAGTTDKAGNLSAGRIMVRGNGMEVDIDKITSSDLSYKIPAGACGTCDPKTYYFNTTQHVWMVAVSSGANDYAPASGGKPADISINTMGGLHMFYGQNKSLNRIVPLSANNFLSISDAAGWTGMPGEDAKLLGLVKTILALDPSVATPVSAEQQIATIQAEKAAYAGQ